MPPTIDLVPEAVEVTGAEPGGPERRSPARLPEALRRFLDRIARYRI